MKGEVQLELLGGSSPRDSDPLLHGHHMDSSLSPLPSSASESPREIKVEDLETASLPCCRICLECDGEDGAGIDFQICEVCSVMGDVYIHDLQARLGGALDATNVICGSNLTASIITTIGKEPKFGW